MGEMIPKKIHYFWFGNNPKPELVNNCILSWRKFFPEFEIIEWNENNYDVNKNAYIREAYESKKWAFVSDYARFDILYNFGGIYFDTDVEVLKRFPDEYLNLSAFTGVESNNQIAPGLVFATKSRLPILKEILEQYDASHFIIEGKQVPMTVNRRVTDLLISKGYKETGELQTVANLTIYPTEYFCGFDLDVFEPAITDNTLSIHHYASTWSYGSFKVKRRIQRVLKKILGVSGYRKVLNLIRGFRRCIHWNQN